MRSGKVLIAGAGPCGLGAAREMLESGPGGSSDFLLVEPGSEPGGWARSETTPEGFIFDFGGHVLFPHKHYAQFAELLNRLGLAWSSSVPQRGLHTQGSFLPYPAQRNIQRLPAHRMFRAIGSVLLNRLRRAEGSASETVLPPERTSGGDLWSYLTRQFGGYLTESLLGPLNRKQWAHAPETLTDVWTQHRSGSTTRNVPDIELTRILRNFVMHADDLGWTPETRVAYPAAGGSGAIWKAIASSIPAEKMLLGTRITAVSLAAKTATLSNGEVVQWERMVSSIPLDVLLGSIPERPELAAKAKRFVRARSRLFGFGVTGALPAKYAGLHSCQVTDADVPFWRLNFPMTVSQGNGPAGCYSMLCEVSEPASEAPRTASELRAQVERSLRDMGLLGSAEQTIVSRWEFTVEHGYPVPFLGRDELLAEVQPVLDAAGLYSRGRFGSWRYEISNQDHAYMQGVEAVRRILFRLPEETFGDSLAVNEIPAAEPSAATAPAMTVRTAVAAG